MRTQTLTLLLLLSIGFSSFSQNIYDVAKAAPDYFENNDGEYNFNPEFLGIIAPHLGVDTSNFEDEADAILQKANDALDANPLLTGHKITSAQSDIETSSILGFDPRNAVKNLAGADVTNIADGIARFLIDRAQAELTLAFFDRFDKFITENPEVKTLFPKTCARLRAVHINQFEQVLDQLRVAFKEDFENLPENLIEVVDNYAETNKMPELMLVTRTLKYVRKLEYLSPPQFISQLPQITSNASEVDVRWYSNLDATFKITAILSNSITDSSNDNYWISTQDFYQRIIEDSTSRKVFLGLIYEKIKKEKIAFNGVELYTKIKNNEIEINWYNDELTRLLDLTERVESAVANFQKAKNFNLEISNEDIHSYITTTLDITKFGYGVYKHYVTRPERAKGNFQNYLNMAYSANDIYRYVYEKDYGSAAMETVALLRDISNLNTEKQAANKSILKTIESNTELSVASGKASLINETKFNSNELDIVDGYLRSMNAGIIASVADAESQLKTKINNEIARLKSTKPDWPWLDKLSTFGVFMANLIDADSAKQVQQILESVALPPGSSTIRKRSKFSSNVTAYLGVGDNARGRGVNLTAPIGVDIGWGLGRRGNGGAISLNAVVLDVGAIVDYRLNNEGTEIESKITLGNILSPGGYLMYAAPYRIPLAVGFGGQYGPGLTGIGTDNIAVVNAPSWQWKFILAVDIPMFNLYSSLKSKL